MVRLLPDSEGTMTDRLDIGDGDSIPMTIAAIQPGDYICSQLAPHIVGRVVRRGIVTRYPAFIIENYRGILAVVLESDTVILGLGNIQDLEQRTSDEFDKA